jgi:hypothetical protein
MIRSIKPQLKDAVNAKEEYPVLWNAIEEYCPALTHLEIGTVIAIVTNMCPHCWEAFWPCNCENDE